MLNGQKIFFNEKSSIFLFTIKNLQLQTNAEPTCFLRREGLLLLCPEASLVVAFSLCLGQGFISESCLAFSLLGWNGIPGVLVSPTHALDPRPQPQAPREFSLSFLFSLYSLDLSRVRATSQLEVCLGPSFLFHLQEEKMGATLRNRIGCSSFPYLQLLHLTTGGPSVGLPGLDPHQTCRGRRSECVAWLLHRPISVILKWGQFCTPPLCPKLGTFSNIWRCLWLLHDFMGVMEGLLLASNG